MTSGNEPAANIAVAGRLVDRAAGDGAGLVVLPEKWNAIDVESRQAAFAEPLDGPSLSAAAQWSGDLGIVLVAGSVSESISGEARVFNTCVVFDRGQVVARYRKMHLFDVAVGGHVYRESTSTRPGDEVVVAHAAGLRVGLSVCYDLRFPELYRALGGAGVDLLTIPAAFTATTGRAHWHVLTRARAVENQAFVLAAGQVGRHATGTDSYGHSLIVDPWGSVLAEVAGGEGVAVADLDFGELDRIRADLPALDHRRL